ncbi:hypothetical protein GALMADRAFT_233989 [Galerina marginata CBS 339.88]|uniref:B30.2/SPRY domain-containing protein n=1 Tax=Galerina marginata (strain CBS 339.88) TaxID=685588 RepID=A0A067TYZ8_GALM3|nr:hypothetical protein GALMADRAFT_233989 [Galerina marginata CBS 339.88]
MNSRPSRSSSIPIPRSTPASASARNTNIESLISIPFVSPTTQPTSPTSSTRQVIEPRRVGLSDGSRGTSTTANVSMSPVRSSPRSATLVSSVPGRDLPRTHFEPRIIRGSGPELPSTDPECLPQPSTSPSQTRRVSAGNVRGTGVQQPIVPQHIARTTPVSFPRPAYLDYSSLRHLLQTEVSPISAAGAGRKFESPNLGSRPQTYLASMSPPSDIDDDVIATPPPQSRPSASTSTPLPQHDQPFKLPTRWSELDRHHNLSVSPDGRELSYQGPSSNADKDAAAARANHPIPLACGIYYFEVEMLGKEQKAHISIGFAGHSVKFGRLPGWDTNSWGYYGDDGCALSAEKTGSSYGPSFGNGDVVGCGVDFTTHKAFYTRNGTLIGPVFDNVGRTSEIYPSVGLQHPGEIIRANFGQEPFKYDIDYHVQQQSHTTWTKILSTSLDPMVLRRRNRRTGAGSIASITNDTGVKPAMTEEDSKDLLNQLVMSYLVHHGYAKTARAFEKQQQAHRGASYPAGDDVDMDRADALENDIECRTNIVNSVLAGDIDSAIDAVQKNYAPVLEADDHLILFKLRCRKFVELILETTEMKKKMKAIRAGEAEKHKSTDVVQNPWTDEEMDMDIDEDASLYPASRTLPGDSFDRTMNGSQNDSTSAENIASQYESALNLAIVYGQKLSNDYQSDPRPELQQLFKNTFGIVAWEDPLEAGGPIADLAGHDARVALAHELNQAILRSQGRPAQPALETLYRHASVCVTQLGLSGVGAAAFADMPREFLETS